MTHVTIGPFLNYDRSSPLGKKKLGKNRHVASKKGVAIQQMCCNHFRRIAYQEPW